MNTIPLAPIRPVDMKSTLMRPVTRAVTAIINSSGFDPYFSSRIGPSSNTKARFPMRWLQFACPITWVRSRGHCRGLVKSSRAPMEKTSETRRPPVKGSRINTSAARSENVSVTGAL